MSPIAMHVPKIAFKLTMIVIFLFLLPKVGIRLPKIAVHSSKIVPRLLKIVKHLLKIAVNLLKIGTKKGNIIQFHKNFHLLSQTKKRFTSLIFWDVLIQSQLTLAN